MSLLKGAQTVIGQCLNVQENETVLILNDGNDQDLIDSLLEVLDEKEIAHELMEYEEPASQGEEPPSEVAEAMKNFDVVIAPTIKSISHTEARHNANNAGARVATLPGINKEIWNSSLQADYEEVERITKKVYGLLKETKNVRVETPSGTSISFEVDFDTYHTDTGIIHERGGFGNLPAGEPSGFPEGIEGTLVIDHFPYAPSGTKVEIRDGEVVALSHPEGVESSQLSDWLDNMDCARKIAEFGFGTNPEATLIGKTLQDEKVLGTVHIAFGDDTSYVSDDRSNPCEIHQDTVCESPTVWFDDKKVLDKGKVVFR